jgi:hypothetical protein
LLKLKLGEDGSRLSLNERVKPVMEELDEEVTDEDEDEDDS